jgi:hypothetical protein
MNKALAAINLRASIHYSLRLRRPLGGREGLHRQRMHFVIGHFGAQRGVYALVALNGALALELGRDDGGIPVAAVVALARPAA